MIVAVIHEATADAVREVMAVTAARYGDRIPLRFEVRLDAMERPDPSVIAGAPREVIATVRRRIDGGSFDGREEERRVLLAEASAVAAWVDIEDDVFREWRPRGGASLLVSLHDFAGCPDDLEQRAASAFMRGATAFKAAVMARDLSDLVRLAALTANCRVVAFGMGPVGIPSRLAHRRVRSPWMYAAVGSRSLELAPSLPRLDELFSPNGPGSALEAPSGVFGVLSDRALDSVGPRVFHRVFRRHDLGGLYVPVTTPHLAGFRAFMDAFGFNGLSVTTPFKESIIGYVDQVDLLARRVGAANTIVRRGERLLATNTDVAGVREPILEAVGPRRGTALVIGTGGAGRAAVVGLLDLGFDVCLASRSGERMGLVARQLGVCAGWPSSPPAVLVNATPAGSARDRASLPVSPELVVRDQVVLEMNYHQDETPLTTLARRVGGRIVSGRAMYAAQAKEQLRCFGFTDPAVATTLDDAVTEELGS